MSSKNKTNPTKEGATPELVPKLRFSEFREAKAWEEKKLGNEGELYSSLTGKAGADFDTGEARFVTYMNVFANTFVDPKALRFVDVKKGENQNAVASGDVFFTISSETPDEVGMSSVLLEDLENCYLNSFCALFRFSESKRPNPVFTGYLLRQPLVRVYFTKKAQGSTRFNLSRNVFRSLPLYVPSPAEQQKIAECLSSVDELIVAQTRKVNALKTHKNGLMQQLFPREGETQPRLRFPDFRNTREWEKTTIGALGNFYYGKSAPKWSLEDKALTPCVRYGELYTKFGPIITKTYSRTNIDPTTLRFSKGGEILVPRVGERPEDFGKCCCYLPLKGIAIGEMISVFETEQNPLFYTYYFRHIYRQFATVVEGQNVKNLYYAVLQPLAICRPPLSEQQRIASCLSSLDDLITAETQKFEALKTHKNGLTQQLFPSAEAFEA